MCLSPFTCSHAASDNRHPNMKILKCIAIVALVSVICSVATKPPELAPVTHKPAAVVQKAAVVAATVVVPEPVAAAAPAPVYPAGCANYLPLIQQYDWNTNMAMAIMQAENVGCNPAIDNAGLNRDGSVDYGLFQVNSIHADMVAGDLESLRTPSVNVAIAYSLSHHGTNWTAWSTYKNGKYLRYLK